MEQQRQKTSECYEKSIKRKLKILKKRPTYERISELSQLIKLFTGDSNIDIFSYELSENFKTSNNMTNICTLIDDILKNPEKYKFLKNASKDPKKHTSKKSLDKILKEKLSVKLYEKIRENEKEISEYPKPLNSENIEPDLDLDTEIIEDLLIEEDSNSENEDDDEGYSLYEEDTDEEENEFSD
jgi:hypothetical protein